MNKTRKIATSVVFAAIIALLGIVHLLLPDAETSYSERRKLALLPELNSETIFSAEYSGDLEDYLLDHFPLRDTFRSLNAIMRFGIFGQKDIDGLYFADGSISKFEGTLDAKHALYCAQTFEKLAERCFGGANLFLTIPPDKNTVLADANGYPAYDYAELVQLMRENSPSMEYVDLFGLLEAEDYYATDSHWRQEKLQPVLDALAAALGTEFDPISDYTQNTLEGFNGVYAGQSALPVAPDTLVYLTNDVTESSTVTSAENGETMPMYTTDRFSGMDGYDVFLGGVQALLTIENPLQTNGRELVIVRDSFGSSLAPLLVSGYEKVTVVDLRYISMSFLPQLLDSSAEANANRDVLFMLSSTMLNSAIVFR